MLDALTCHAHSAQGMARKLGVQYLGAIYHVINRGGRREPIFEDDQDRCRFLETLTDAGKLELASELRARTTMPRTWIAQRLQAGYRRYLTRLLY